MAALLHMNDEDLKALSIPMVTNYTLPNVQQNSMSWLRILKIFISGRKKNGIDNAFDNIYLYSNANKDLLCLSNGDKGLYF